MGEESGVQKVAFLNGYDRNLYCLAAMAAVRARGLQICCVCTKSLTWSEIRRRIKQLGFSGFLNRLRHKVTKASRRESEGYLLTRLLRHFGVKHRQVSNYCRQNSIPHLFCRDINDETCVNFIRAHCPDVLIYAGGGLLRKPLLSAANIAAVNAHLGALPDFKGSNTIEWSLAVGSQPAVTAHTMTEKLDCGTPLKTVFLRCADSLAQTKSRALLAAVLLLAEIAAKMDSCATNYPEQTQKAGKMFYTMHPFMKQILDAWLREKGS